jgi:hypothetical protein
VSLFVPLLGKILPLYTNIVLGYLATRLLKVDRAGAAALLFYLMAPIVVFSATMGVHLDAAVALLPLFLFLFSSLMAVAALWLFKRLWPDATGNILAFTAGTGNTGYFGIALALIVFEPRVADIYIFTVLASFFYESTTGFYITAKGTFTARESLAKVLRLPVLYAFLLALILNLAGVRLPESLAEYLGQFRIAYSIIGIMLIGMGLVGFRQGRGVDRRFLALTLAIKHLLWPALIALIIWFDTRFFGLLHRDLYRVMFVFAIVPLAGNTVTLAVLLNARPEKAALAVLLSTLLSIITIPFMLAWYGME